MTLNDETEITYSDICVIDGIECVKVFVERPTDGGFDHIECTLPRFDSWKCTGFSKEDEDHIRDIITKGAHLFFKYAKAGGTKDLAAAV